MMNTSFPGVSLRKASRGAPGAPKEAGLPGVVEDFCGRGASPDDGHERPRCALACGELRFRAPQVDLVVLDKSGSRCSV
jgi:hypothetical protein